MSKRKIGGHEISSDCEEEPSPPPLPKKSKTPSARVVLPALKSKSPGLLLSQNPFLPSRPKSTTNTSGARSILVNNDSPPSLGFRELVASHAPSTSRSSLPAAGEIPNPAAKGVSQVSTLRGDNHENGGLNDLVDAGTKGKERAPDEEAGPSTQKTNVAQPARLQLEANQDFDYTCRLLSEDVSKLEQLCRMRRTYGDMIKQAREYREKAEEYHEKAEDYLDVQLMGLAQAYPDLGIDFGDMHRIAPDAPVAPTAPVARALATGSTPTIESAITLNLLPSSRAAAGMSAPAPAGEATTPVKIIIEYRPT